METMIRKSDPALYLKTLTVYSENQSNQVINALVNNGYAVWMQRNLNAATSPFEGYAQIEYVHKDVIAFNVRPDPEEKKPKRYGLVIRPVLDWFSMNMEEILRQNDFKGGWKERSIKSLIDSASECVASIRLLHRMHNRGGSDTEAIQRFIRKCINLANYAMMIADNAKDFIDIPNDSSDSVSEEDECLPIG